MKRLLSFLIVFLFAILPLQAKTFVVCVGIADYPDRQNDLRVSANDAMTISGIFTKNGNAMVDCFVNSDVTIKKVCTAMRNTFAKASPSDVIILYLRGGADTNKDRVITAKEIYNFVHQGVVEASGNRQHPVMWGKFDGNMVVMKW